MKVFFYLFAKLKLSHDFDKIIKFTVVRGRSWGKLFVIVSTSWILWNVIVVMKIIILR